MSVLDLRELPGHSPLLSYDSLLSTALSLVKERKKKASSGEVDCQGLESRPTSKFRLSSTSGGVLTGSASGSCYQVGNLSYCNLKSSSYRRDCLISLVPAKMTVRRDTSTLSTDLRLKTYSAQAVSALGHFCQWCLDALDRYGCGMIQA